MQRESCGTAPIGCIERTKLIKKKDSGKVYDLILGQCTQVLLEALQEDADWDNVSMKCDHIELYKLIEKCVLKQTLSTYPYLTIIEEFRGLGLIELQPR